jgi:sarcosine oxidase subunit gamma
MIALKGDLSDPALRALAEEIAGAALPAPQRMERGEGTALFWMAPDEILIRLPPDRVEGALARIARAAGGLHHLAQDMSDARAVLTVEGPFAREVMAKLTPLDLHPEAFPPGSFRRTRLGQIAAGIWCADADRFGVMVFRSLADDAAALLEQSAADGPVGLF